MEEIHSGLTEEQLVEKLNNNFSLIVEKENTGLAPHDNQIESVRSVNDIGIFPSVPNSYPGRNDAIGGSICFIFDSSKLEIIERHGRGNGFPFGGWKEIFESKDIKFSMSTGRFDVTDPDSMTASQCLSLVNDGFPLMAHSLLGNHEDKTEGQLYEVLKAQKEYFLAHGFNPKNSNYLGGKYKISGVSAIRNFYKSGGTVRPGVNWEPINTFQLKRTALDNGNFNTWIFYVDKLFNNKKGFATFYGHPYKDHWYEEKRDDDGNPDANGDYTWQKIVRLIDYIKTKDGYGDIGGIEIISLDEAIEKHGNVIDIGFGRNEEQQKNPDEFGDKSYFRLSKSGELANRKIDLIQIDNGYRIGPNAGDNNSSSSIITFGSSAGRLSNEATLDDEIFLGTNSGRECTSGSNIGIGSNALRDNTQPYCVGIGAYAGSANTGRNLVAIGEQAGANNVGLACVAIGRNALLNNSNVQCTAIGDNAGKNNSKAYITAIGLYAGAENKGSSGTFIGTFAGRNNTGTKTTGIGCRAALSNTGDNMVAIGYQAGEDNCEANVLLIENRNVCAENPLIKGYFDTGSIVLGAPSNDVADEALGPNRVSFYLDEASDKLKFKVKYSDGTTIKKGEIDLT